jgi:hypothetical protein
MNIPINNLHYGDLIQIELLLQEQDDFFNNKYFFIDYIDNEFIILKDIYSINNEYKYNIIKSNDNNYNIDIDNLKSINVIYKNENVSIIDTLGIKTNDTITISYKNVPDIYKNTINNLQVIQCNVGSLDINNDTISCTYIQDENTIQIDINFGFKGLPRIKNEDNELISQFEYINTSNNQLLNIISNDEDTEYIYNFHDSNMDDIQLENDQNELDTIIPDDKKENIIDIDEYNESLYNSMMRASMFYMSSSDNSSKKSLDKTFKKEQKNIKSIIELINKNTIFDYEKGKNIYINKIENDNINIPYEFNIINEKSSNNNQYIPKWILPHKINENKINIKYKDDDQSSYFISNIDVEDRVDNYNTIINNEDDLETLEKNNILSENYINYFNNREYIPNISNYEDENIYGIKSKNMYTTTIFSHDINNFDSIDKTNTFFKSKLNKKIDIYNDIYIQRNNHNENDMYIKGYTILPLNYIHILDNDNNNNNMLIKSIYNTKPINIYNILNESIQDNNTTSNTIIMDDNVSINNNVYNILNSDNIDYFKDQLRSLRKRKYFNHKYSMYDLIETLTPFQYNQVNMVNDKYIKLLNIYLNTNIRKIDNYLKTVKNVNKEYSRIKNNKNITIRTKDNNVNKYYKTFKNNRFGDSERLNHMVSVDDSLLYIYVKIQNDLRNTTKTKVKTANQIKEYIEQIQSSLSKKSKNELDDNPIQILSKIKKEYKIESDIDNDNDKIIYVDKKYNTIDYSKYNYLRDDTMNNISERKKITMIKNTNKQLGYNLSLNEIKNNNKEIEDGDYAVLIKKNEVNTNVQNNYYIRKDNKWILDTSATEKIISDNIEDTCNLYTNMLYMYNHKNELQCKNISTIDDIHNDNLNTYIDNIVSKYEEYDMYRNMMISRDINDKILYQQFYISSYYNYLDKVKRNNERFIKNITQSDNIENDNEINNIYEDLRDKILGDTNYSRKMKNLKEYIVKYTRGPNIIYKEDINWLYTKDTNTKILPKFLKKLAYSFNTIYNSEHNKIINRICSNQGVISSDGDKWIDKHSGYIIIDRTFEDTEYKGEDKINVNNDIDDNISSESDNEDYLFIFNIITDVVSHTNLNINLELSDYYNIYSKVKENYNKIHTIHKNKGNNEISKIYNKIYSKSIHKEGEEQLKYSIYIILTSLYILHVLRIKLSKLKININNITEKSKNYINKKSLYNMDIFNETINDNFNLLRNILNCFEENKGNKKHKFNYIELLSLLFNELFYTNKKGKKEKKKEKKKGGSVIITGGGKKSDTTFNFDKFISIYKYIFIEFISNSPSLNDFDIRLNDVENDTNGNLEIYDDDDKNHIKIKDIFYSKTLYKKNDFNRFYSIQNIIIQKQYEYSDDFYYRVFINLVIIYNKRNKDILNNDILDKELVDYISKIIFKINKNISHDLIVSDIIQDTSIDIKRIVKYVQILTDNLYEIVNDTNIDYNSNSTKIVNWIELIDDIYTDVENVNKEIYDDDDINVTTSNNIQVLSVDKLKEILQTKNVIIDQKIYSRLFSSDDNVNNQDIDKLSTLFKTLEVQHKIMKSYANSPDIFELIVQYYKNKIKYISESYFHKLLNKDKLTENSKIYIPKHWNLSNIHVMDLTSQLKKSYNFNIKDIELNDNKLTEILKKIMNDNEISNISNVMKQIPNIFVKKNDTYILDVFITVYIRILVFYYYKYIDELNESGYENIYENYMYKIIEHEINDTINHMKNYILSNDELFVKVNRRNEDEKNEIVSMIENMNEDQRMIEYIQKDYKLGRYNIGKELREYSPDGYDKERDSRINVIDKILKNREIINETMSDMNNDYMDMYSNYTIEEQESIDLSNLPEDDDYGENDEYY